MQQVGRMSLFPASTNRDYQGAKIASWFLVVLSLGTIVPGGIHFFLPDGGAETIAGLELGEQRDLVIAVFAWMGATQIPYGLAQLAVGLAYRSLTSLFLALAFIERCLAASAAWITKSSGTGHHPPEHFAVLIVAPLTLVFLALSLRRRRS
jgi:hypothetical protein